MNATLRQMLTMTCDRNINLNLEKFHYITLSATHSSRRQTFKKLFRSVSDQIAFVIKEKVRLI